MSGDVTYQALDRLTYLPDRDPAKNGNVIAGQNYYDVHFTGGDLSGVTISDSTIDPTNTLNISEIHNGAAVLTLPTITTTILGRDTTDTLTNKTFDANGTGNSLSNVDLPDFAVNVIDTDPTLAANSNGRLATQAATKSYVDASLAGLKWKTPVRVATTTAGTLASSFENGDTVDGVVLATNDRILIKNQADPKENGIYFVNASGAPTRALDADTGAELVNAAVLVSQGNVNAGSQWTCNVTSITIGVTDIVFVQISIAYGNTGFLNGGTAAGTADALTITVTPSLGSYSLNTRISFLASQTNTGAATVNVSGLGVKNITKKGGIALAAGDIVVGINYIEYDGTRFELTTPTATTVELNATQTLTNKTITALSATGTSTLAGAVDITSGDNSANLDITGSTHTITTSVDGAGGLLTVSTNGYLLLGTNSAERMRISSSGAVLINTTAQVGSTRLCIDDSSGSGQVRCRHSTGLGLLLNQSSASGQASILNQDAGDLGIGANNTQLMWLKSSGYISTGVQTPAFTNGVHVITHNSGRSGITFNNTDATAASQSTIIFNRNSVGVGTITTTNTTTSYNTSSDIRIKEDIQPIGNVGLVIDSLRPCTWKFKIDKEGERGVGFIAQELAKIVSAPGLVNRGDDNPDLHPGDEGFVEWSVDAAKLIPYLVAEMQSLRQRVRDLEKQKEIKL